MGKNIRVLIVEDHDMARMGLSVVLGNNPNIEVAGMSADGQEGVDKALELLPDVVVMDIGLPTIDGIEATKRIKLSNSNIKVLMYTSRESEDDIFDSFQAGADGYITKGATSEQTVAAVIAVSEGAGWLDPAIAKVKQAKAPMPEKAAEAKNTPKPIELPNLKEIPEIRHSDPVMEIL